MSLNTIIKLKIADAIWEGGSNAPLSPNEILTKIRPQRGRDAENLQRMLCMLTSYRVFEEHVVDDDSQRRSVQTSRAKLGRVCCYCVMFGLPHSSHFVEVAKCQ
ncbi:uncharacterized protein LOC107002599 [Solanum pennellii]|nr:uncharacterized protein LOC107002599 [Solanum pennellii]